MTETLLSSELFGHERGAFTGATERKIGRFERADGGTLFLDEISDISENTQVKLLRILQDGKYERVGSSKPLRVDVRLICATNKQLAAEVQAGKFREDLYYRINVILLRIPPLRERKEDIPLLVNYFLKHFAQKNQKKVDGLSADAMKQLQAYHWPGNIRELRNVIERMVVLTNQSLIDAVLVPDNMKSGLVSVRKPHGIIPLGQGNLSDMERSVIEQTLRTSRGNKSLTAKHLGISRRTLYRKLSEYQIKA